VALPHPQWCCKSLLWRDTGQVSDSTPHPERPVSTPIQMLDGAVPLTQRTHAHSDIKPRLYTHVHPERPPPISTPARAHSRSTLNAPSYREQHVNACTLAYLKHAHTATDTCVRTTTTHNQHLYIHMLSHTRAYPQTHICSSTATRTGVCIVAYPDQHGPHEGVQSHMPRCTDTSTLSPGNLRPVCGSFKKHPSLSIHIRNLSPEVATRPFKTLGVPDPLPSHSLPRKEAHCQGKPHSFSAQAIGTRLGSQPASLWPMDSLVRKAGSDLGTWHAQGQVPCNTSSGPSSSQPLPPSHRGLGCTSQSRTDRELGEREGGLPGVGSCDQPWVGRGVSSHRRGEDGSPHTAL
jgi:hypothetical protein